MKLSQFNTDYIKNRILEKGPFSQEENLRIYEKSFSNIAHSRPFKLLVEKYSLHEKAVLDVGCYCGSHLIHFGEGSVGLERQDAGVKFALAIGLNVIQCNVEDKWEFTEGPFDAAWCSAILEHVVSPHKLLRECWRKLKYDGLLFARVPIIPNPIVESCMRCLPQWRNRFHSGYTSYSAVEHLYAYTRKSAIFLIKRAGFEVIDVNTLWPPIPLLNRILKPLIYRFGITDSLTVIAKKDPEFKYPEKRLKAFTPGWMLELDKR